MAGSSIPLSTSHRYLVITTGIWMNDTKRRPKVAQNVPFGVFGVMLPYKTIRLQQFSDLCVRI